MNLFVINNKYVLKFIKIQQYICNIQFKYAIILQFAKLF